MKCNKCRKKIRNESKFCRYCGCEIENVNSSSKEEKTTKISFKTAITFTIIGIIVLCSLIALGVVLVNSNKEVVSSENNINSEETKSIAKQEEISVKEEIPENEKVMVLFQDEEGNTSLEERRIPSRESLIDYVALNRQKVKQDVAKKGWATLDARGVIYYVEYDCEINGYPKIKDCDWGSIIFFSLAKSGYGSKIQYKTVGTIWTPFTNGSNNYIMKYESGISNNQPNIENVLSNNYYNILKKDYMNSSSYSNFRIGTISKTNNPWFLDYVEQNNSNEKKEDSTINTTQNNNTINSSYEEIYNAYKDIISNCQEYCLVDINNDKTIELVAFEGTCNADYKFVFYTYQNGSAIKLGENFASSGSLYKMNDGNYIRQINNSGQSEYIWNISYDNGSFKIEEISYRALTPTDFQNNNFSSGGDILIKMYKNTDLTPFK